MTEWATKRSGVRSLVVVAALLSAVAAFVVPGSLAYAAGMVGFMLLPLLLGSGVGKVSPTAGGVRYGTSRSQDQAMDLTFRIIGVVAVAAFAYFGSIRDATIFAVFGALIGNGCAALLLLNLIGSFFVAERGPNGVTLEATTLSLAMGDGIKVVSYDDLRTVKVDGRTVTLATSTERHVVFVNGPAARAVDLARRINEAKASAAVAAHARDDVRMEGLRRASGVSTREWFGRIDALAAASRAGDAYRGRAIDEEHLCGVLADEEADVESRTAAARALASSDNPEVRTRVASTVKDISDDRARVRVELAMRADTDEAVAEMEALEMEELRETAGR